MYDPRDMYELAAEDTLAREERYAPKRRLTDCCDGMCGAIDCRTCRPEGEKPDEDDPEPGETGQDVDEPPDGTWEDCCTCPKRDHCNDREGLGPCPPA